MDEEMEGWMMDGWIDTGGKDECMCPTERKSCWHTMKVSWENCPKAPRKHARNTAKGNDKKKEMKRGTT